MRQLILILLLIPTLLFGQSAQKVKLNLQVTPASEVGQSAPTVASPVQIPLDFSRATTNYRIIETAASRLSKMNDGAENGSVDSTFIDFAENNVRPWKMFYRFQAGMNVTISSLWYQGHNKKSTNPMLIYAIKADGSKQLIHTRTNFGYVAGSQVGTTITLPTPVRAVGFSFEANSQGPLTGGFSYPIEFRMYGSYTPVAPAQYTYFPVKLGNMLGINFHQWDVQTNNPKNLDPVKWPLFTGSFNAGRIYMEGNVIEPKLGTFEYDHTNTGGWNFDMIYQGAQDAGIVMLVDIKNTQDTISNSYPNGSKRAENVPRFYTSDTLHNGDPFRYKEQARGGFQFGVRYGRNTNIPDSAIRVTPAVIFPNSANPIYRTKKKGLGTVLYVENENERDKTWFGRIAQQTPAEYAANLSAFYDGHMGRLGYGYGVKTADSTMKVVQNGIAGAYAYFVPMIDWCERYRGRLPDGTVNICWDPIVNIHQYSNNVGSGQHSDASIRQRSVCPDVVDSSNAGANIEALKQAIADQVALGRIKNHQIWMTEAGFDYHPGSILRVDALPGYTVDETIAIYSERSWGYYGALGVTYIFNYQYNSEKVDPTTYNTMNYFNIIDGTNTRKPVADYAAQVKYHWSNYAFQNWLTRTKNLHVQRWNNGTADVYRIVIPREQGETGTYTLSIPGKTSVTVYTPRTGATTMATTTVTGSGSFVIPTSCRAVYVQAN